MASSLFPTIQFFDDAGAVLNGGLIYHYEPGTTTDKDVYPTLADADVASGNESAQPVVLDSAGRPPSEGIWMTGLTKIVVKNSAGTTIKTYDSAGDGSGTNAMPKNHIAGLTLSLDADTDHDINVTAGEARDAADSEDMALAGEITKQIDAGIWAVGDDAAGMDTADAITADTDYYVWLIKRTDTGVVDVLVSASSTAPTMPTSYDKKRLIGRAYTNAASNIDAVYGPDDAVAGVAFAKGKATGLKSINGHGMWGSRNLLTNGDMRVAQRGTAFTSATTPANSDDTYLLDRWYLLSDGNDIVDVNQLTDAALGNYAYLEADVETTQKKFGFAQIIEQKDLAFVLGADKTVSLSFRAKVSDITKLDNIKAVVLSWNSTADSVTSDMVSAWGAADTTPTWATNWTAENTPANLSVTASDAVYKIEGISVDTASVANLAVFIWSDAVADNDTLGTKLHITEVQLEPGSTATEFEHRPIADEIQRCERYAVGFTTDSTQKIGGQGAAIDTTRVVLGIPLPTEMRGGTAAIEATAADWALTDNVTSIDVTAISVHTSMDRYVVLNIDVASGLTQYRSYHLRSDGGGSSRTLLLEDEL